MDREIEMDWPAIAERFRQLYVPAVCDVLDRYGLRHQYLDHGIKPLDVRHRLAGPAFTILGGPNASTDTKQRIGPRVIDSFEPGVVAIYETLGDETTGVWGELWSAGAAQRGCVGAVVDGGIRDTAFIRTANFPIFYRFACPADAVGRFSVIDYRCPVSVGGVRVHPGDYVFGDEDGVAIIPAAITMEVLVQAEEVRTTEDRIRGEISADKSLADLYREFGRF